MFCELAIRHAIRKPLVQLIKRGEQIPFDVAGTRTIHVDHHDLDSVEEAKRDIADQIRSLEKDPTKLETPISVSLDLQLLKQSDNPEQRSLADLLSVISEMRSSLASLEKRLANPEALIPREYLRIIADTGSARSPRFRHAAMELRQLVQEVVELAGLTETQSSIDQKDLEEKFVRLNHVLNRITHDGL